jgi:hypothetical protein
LCEFICKLRIEWPRRETGAAFFCARDLAGEGSSPAMARSFAASWVAQAVRNFMKHVRIVSPARKMMRRLSASGWCLVYPERKMLVRWKKGLVLRTCAGVF